MSGQQPQTKTKPPPPPTRMEIFAGRPASHALDRFQVVVDGRSYEIFRAVPRGSMPAAGWPVLYLLDGNAAFDFLTPELLARHAGLVLVGVGYATPLRFSPPERVLDYTPPRRADDPRPDPDRPDRQIGGGALFAARLLGSLRSAAEAGIDVDASRRMLFGHSLAGLFAIHLLLTRPGSFARTVAASPSIWWGDEFALGVEALAAFPDGLRHEMLVTLGDSERRSSPTGPHWEGPAPHTLEMVRRLRARPGISVECDILPGAAHPETFARSLPLALDFCSRWP